MADPFRLSLVVQHANGTETRWGPDELDPADIPVNLQCSDTLPGGFEELSCDLLRRIDLAAPDQNLLDRVLLLGPGNEVVWEGRFGQFPRETSDGYTVSPGAEGYSAHLRDDTSFREIYVDRDLSQWEPPSASRQANLLASTPAYKLADGTAEVGSDPSALVPALVQSMSRVSTTSGSISQMVESQYNSRGVSIGKLYYDQTQYDLGNAKGQLAAGWGVQAAIGDDDVFGGTGPVSTANLQGSASAGFLTTTLTSRTVAALQMYYGGTLTSDGEWRVYWRRLAVYGNHGLTLYTNGSEPQGVIASDVLANALSRAAPLLNFTTGPGGTIATTQIVFSHLVFREMTTVEEVVKKVNAVHLYPWFVWENRTFYFQPDDNTQPWTVRLGDGAHLKDDGPSGQNVINKVFVQYTDPAGRSRTAGPTGSGCDTEDAQLEDTDSANPANSHGIPTKSETIALSSIADDAMAVAIGAIYLTERAKQQRRGEAQITGLAQHPTMGMRPCWAIRAGDYIQFVDTLDDSISEPRRIIRKVYDHDRRTATLSLDSTPWTLDALLELLDAELVSVG